MLLLLFSAQGFAIEIPFSSANIIDGTFDGSLSVYTVDLDGDGDMDVLGAAQYDSSIVWWENTAGDGSSWTEYTIDSSFGYASSVYAADIDGDGDVDVLGAALLDDEIAWWVNDGTPEQDNWTKCTIDGSFDGAFSVYAADVDGDEDLDVLGAAQYDDSIAWWVNDGTPEDANWTMKEIDAAFCVYATDVDGDTDVDVLGAAIGDDDIACWENDGTPVDGGWTEHTIDGSFDGASSVYAADIDGDGDVDIVGSAMVDDDVTWWENTSGSISSCTSEHTIDGSFDMAMFVYVTDMDHDGDLDVLAEACWGDDITWWENDGSPGDGGWTERVIDSSFSADGKCHAADVDGDGDVDVLGTGFSGDDVVWWENKTIHFGLLSFKGYTIDGSFDDPHCVRAGDVNGDGHMDVLAVANIDDDLTWWENDGSPGDGGWTEHGIDLNLNQTRGVGAADLNRDGDLDVIATAYNLVDTATDVLAYINSNGSGTSWGEFSADTDFGCAWGTWPADIDSDGNIDIVAAAFWHDEVAWYDNANGSGASWTKHTVATSFNGAQHVHAGDVDGDGDMDIVGSAVYGDEVAWFENANGSGTSWTAHTIVSGATWDNPHEVYMEDVNGDGHVDVVFCHAGGTDEVLWFENDGSPADGGWTEHTVDGGFHQARSVFAADVDNDGDIDILGGSPTGPANSENVSIWENMNGSGTSWTQHLVDPTFNYVYCVFGADVDGDGDMDVLVASKENDDIAWWENAAGQFALETIDTAPTSLGPGETDDMLKIEAFHKGRSGDTDMELATLKLLFEESASDPLTTTEANNLINTLYIYLDTGNGTFQSGSDTLVETISELSLSSGVQTVTFTDGDSNVQVSAASSAIFFVVVKLASDACDHTPPNAFLITHVTDGSDVSTAEDRDYDIPLVLGSVDNVSSKVMTIDCE